MCSPKSTKAGFYILKTGKRSKNSLHMAPHFRKGILTCKYTILKPKFCGWKAMTWTLLVYRIGYVGDPPSVHMGKWNSGIALTSVPIGIYKKLFVSPPKQFSIQPPKEACYSIQEWNCSYLKNKIIKLHSRQFDA